MLAAQNNRCGICEKIFSGPPYVDHDHATGKVRALLCNRCNLGIGHFYDDPALLQRAISYLQKVKLLPIKQEAIC